MLACYHVAPLIRLFMIPVTQHSTILQTIGPCTYLKKLAVLRQALTRDLFKGSLFTCSKNEGAQWIFPAKKGLLVTSLHIVLLL